MTCPRLHRGKAGFESVSRVQTEPYWPAGPAHPDHSRLDPRVVSPQEEELGQSAVPSVRLEALSTEAKGEAERHHKVTGKHQPYARCQRGQSSNANKSQDVTKKLGKGLGDNLDPALSRVPSCWRPGGPAAPALRDWDPAGSTISPLYGASLKKSPIWLSEQLWLEHTV